ncbi:MAG: hypothetical protein DMG09_13930 [Acidobacteria bacterium]|nr:MAG: hypothetical protein DMG09_13930 [Acidobacteriota bacterium]
MSLILFGAYGVFGSWLSQELAVSGIPFTIAGRDRQKAEALAERLHANTRVQVADVNDLSSCSEALRDHHIAVHCAGPFSNQSAVLIEACWQAGCHYVDIADDRKYLARVRGYGKIFRENQLSAVYGCSSLPGISGALALLLKQENPEIPEKIRLILFIGNHNKKGAGAIEAVFKISGRKIPTPQRTLIGLRKEARVELPAPFGKKSALIFESADYDLLPEIIGTKSIVVDVSFEMEIANRIFSVFSHSPFGLVQMLKIPVLKLGALFNRWGHEGGGVRVEFFYRNGSLRRATLLASREGQRMAIVPAFAAIQKILGGSAQAGVFTAYDFLGAAPLLESLTAKGYSLILSGDKIRQ